MIKDSEKLSTTQLIYLINSQLGVKKIGQNLIFQACPIR